MRTLLRENYVEALIGLVVVVLGVWFVVFAWARTGGSTASNAIHVKAMFGNATGIDVGTDVRIAGLKVGTVSALTLDPKTFQAQATLALDPSVKIPADSSAAVASEGLLGGNYMNIIPGGDPQPLKDGSTILDTQGSMDLMSLIGSFVNRGGGSSGGTGSAGGMMGGAGAGDGMGGMGAAGGATPAP